VSETTCPFCASALPETKSVVPGTTQRLSRAAAYAFTATVAVTTGGALVACSSSSAVYGAPAVVDSGADADAGAAQPLYGGGPVDSGGG
jgi:hypothetical protein